MGSLTIISARFGAGPLAEASTTPRSWMKAMVCSAVMLRRRVRARGLQGCRPRALTRRTLSFVHYNFHLQQAQPSSGGKGLGRRREFPDETFQCFSAGIKIVPVFYVPGGNETEPFGSLEIGLVGHIEEQGDLFQPE